MDFEEFYAATYRRIVVAAAVTLGNLTEAEDVVQEAFERAHRHWPRIRQYEDPEGWVRRVTYNLSLNTIRRARRKATALTRLAGRLPSADLPPPPEIVDIHRALSRLPIHYRAVLTLRYLLDLSVRQIADTLELPEETVKSQLARGRRRLRNELGGQIDGSAGEALW
ncbi:MAG: SigE family RNA polymerase sigma factor [Kineosporiaceae bacterium]|nr:SigE family RNA polymerase sigma factor [Kineosporiaceae bacterium]MBK8075814.1 SigE family RNA polymerase sigma factor [Kineosporiaceae bacterium]